MTVLKSTCPKCGERNGPDDVVCWACGMTLPARDSSLTCLICSQTMLRLHRDGLWLDGCSHCGGIWLDRGELESARHLTVETLAVIDAKLGWTSDPPGGVGVPAGDRSCPACRLAMRETPAPKASGVRVDVCHACQGVWLDPGEIDRIQSGNSRNLPRASALAGRGSGAGDDVGAVIDGAGLVLEILFGIIGAASDS
jgi:Zn-finger nucleic acid-binding protein